MIFFYSNAFCGHKIGILIVLAIILLFVFTKSSYTLRSSVFLSRDMGIASHQNSNQYNMNLLHGHSIFYYHHYSSLESILNENQKNMLQALQLYSINNNMNGIQIEEMISLPEIIFHNCHSQTTDTDQQQLQQQQQYLHNKSKEKEIILVWDCKIPTFDMKIENIYAFIDEVTNELHKIRFKTNCSNIVWAAGTHLLSLNDSPDSDASLLLLYQSLHHIVFENGFTVLPVERIHVSDSLRYLYKYVPYTSSTSSSSTSTAKKYANGIIFSNLYDQCQFLLYTRKFNKVCFPQPVELLPILITGLGGCGTHSISTKLQSIGAKIYHERVGIHGAVSWTYLINDVMMNLNYPWGGGNLLHRSSVSDRSKNYELISSSIFNPRFSNLYGLVREPINHIGSFSAHMNTSYEFVSNALNQFPHQLLGTNSFLVKYRAHLNKLNRKRKKCNRAELCNIPFAAMVYMLWNELLYKSVDTIYHIDNDNEVRGLERNVCNIVQTCGDDANHEDHVIDMPPKERKKKHETVKTRMLKSLILWEDLLKASRNYGYEIE
jgi:hypothetical protein